MTVRFAALLLVACTAGCAVFDPIPPAHPPHHAWALSDPGTPIPGETPRTERISEARVAFELPSGKWAPQDHWVSGAEAVLHSFRRHVSSPGRRPTITFLVEHVGSGYENAGQFAAAKRPELAPYTIDRELRPDEVGLPGAVAFRVHSDAGGIAHSMFIVYALRGQIGIVVFMDVPTARFNAVAPEFRAALRSLRYYR